MRAAFGDVRFRGLLGQVSQKPNNDGDLCAFLLPRNGPGKHMGSRCFGALETALRSRAIMRSRCSQAPSLIGAARRRLWPRQRSQLAAQGNDAAHHTL